MKKAEKEKLRNEIIDEGIKQGLSANEILERFKEREVGIQRKKGLEMIRKRKGKRKKAHAQKHIPKKYRKKFLCCKKVSIIFFGYNRVGFKVIDSDKSVKEIYEIIEKYEPEREYDEVEADVWASDKEVDKKYKLTLSRLKSLVYLPFARSKNLKTESVNTFIDNLIFEFDKKNIYPREQNLKFLRKVKKILIEKKYEEQLSWREIFEETEGVERA